MRSFFQRLANSIRRFMYGRYGNDELNYFIMIVSFILMAVALLPYMMPLYLVSFALVVWYVFRCLSKDFLRRRRELEVYVRAKRSLAGKAALQRCKWRDRKTHRYIKCPTCRAIIRIPRRRGGGTVICPRCKGRITKKH